MIEVELPDGSIAEFPEGTTPDVIKGALQKRFAAPQAQPQYIQKDPNAVKMDWGKGLQKADDLARGIANGATLGMADRFAGMMGDGTDAERAKSAQAQERSPVLYTGGEIAGTVAGLGKLQGMGLTTAGLLPKGAGLLGKMGAGAVDSLAINEAMNAGYGRDFGDNAGLAAIAGGAAPAIGQGISALGSKALGMFNKAPAVQSVDDISAAAERAYREADTAGGVFPAKDFVSRVDKIKAMLADDAYLPGNQPGVREAVSELDRLSGQNITFKGLEATRRKIRGGYNPGNKDNNRMLYKVMDEIDDFAETGGSGLYPEARKLYAQKSKIESVQSALDQGKKRALLTGSGGNVDNATRQRLDRVAEKMRGATPDERAALNEAAYGTRGRNVLRAIGRAAPSNGALPLIANVAAGAASPLMVAGSLVAEGSKRLSERGTRKAAEKVMKIIAAGGHAAAIQAPKNSAQKAIESKRDLITRLLMGGGLAALPAN